MGDGAFYVTLLTVGMTSVYLVSPALTWGELQLHRPHAITGSFLQPVGIGRPECTAVSPRPFEVTGTPRWSTAQSLAQVEHVPFGVGDTAVPVETAFSLDEAVMGDRTMRSGAFLVQRGPVRFESLFLRWPIGGSRDAVATYW
jgi:hypothetical protein